MKIIGGEARDVVWSESRDNGGMFDSEVGVYRDGDHYRAYVTDSWGAGIRSRQHESESVARGDIERLWDRLYG
jgi:hypothetical protein